MSAHSHAEHLSEQWPGPVADSRTGDAIAEQFAPRLVEGIGQLDQQPEPILDAEA